MTTQDPSDGGTPDTYWIADNRLPSFDAQTDAEAREQAAEWFAENPPSADDLRVEDFAEGDQ